MTFLVLLFVLSGLLLIFSGFNHEPLQQYLAGWIGTKK